MRLKSFLACILLVITLLAVGCSPTPARSITGRIIYSGEHTGEVIVEAIRPGVQGPSGRYGIGLGYFAIDSPPMNKPYTIRVLYYGTYTVSAYLDTNDNNEQEPDEPSGYYDGNGDGEPDEVFVDGEVTDIDITMRDP